MLTKRTQYHLFGHRAARDPRNHAVRAQEVDRRAMRRGEAEAIDTPASRPAPYIRIAVGHAS